MGIRLYTVEQPVRGHAHALARRKFTTDGYNKVLLIQGKPYIGYSKVLYDVEAELAKNGKSLLEIAKLRGKRERYIFRSKIVEKNWEIEMAKPPPAIAAGKLVVTACLVPEVIDIKAEDLYQTVGRKFFPKVISVEEAPEVQ